MRTLRSLQTAAVVVLIVWATLLGCAFAAVNRDATGRHVEAQGAVEQKQARFLFAAPGQLAHQVSLPHTWRHEGLPNSGQASYQLTFHLREVPSTSWGLRIDRLASHHTIHVNGHLLVDTTPSGRAGRVPFPVPAWVEVPPLMLQPGANLIDVQAHHASRGGLSTVWLGPTAELQPLHDRYVDRTVRLPQAMNFAAAGLSIFMVLLWLNRPSEKVLGLFGTLWTMVSLRNVAYYSAGNYVHGAATDFLFFAAQVGSIWLLGLFGLAWSQLDWRWFRHALFACSSVMLVAGAFAAWQSTLLSMRYAAYPVLMTLALPAIWLIVSVAWKVRGVAEVALAAGLCGSVMAGVHDYLVLAGHLSVMTAYWLPFATPFALIAAVFALLKRFVGALVMVERHSLELETKVAERTQDLHAANAAKARFLAAASHDLRQPVVAVSLYAGLLQQELGASPSRPLVDNLVASTLALDTLLSGLLNLSRLEGGGIKPQWQSLALSELVERVCMHEATQARSKGLTLRIRIPSGLHVWADTLLLEQVLRNLVANAICYTTHGGVLIGVRRDRAGHVKLGVWDTGCGIPPHMHERIFEAFVKLNNPGVKTSRGLGLALVKSACELLGSPILLRSEPGRGSCFCLVLAETETVLPNAEVGALASSMVWQGRHVVLVEDDDTVRSALVSQLVRWGAHVDAFADGTSAHRAVGACVMPPDLVLSDQRLPDGLGSEWVSAWRQQFEPLPLAAVIITADTHPDDIAILTSSGLPVLHKPFNAMALTRVVAPLLANPQNISQF